VKAVVEIITAVMMVVKDRRVPEDNGRVTV
jgi:hypothetical protein